MLGTREPDVYGPQTLAEIDEAIARAARAGKLEVRSAQFNSEGAMIEAIHAAIGTVDGIVINPGAFTHYAYAVRDALAGSGLPVVEVHLSNVFAREPFRAYSVIAPIAKGTVSGFGATSYVLALQALAAHLRDNGKPEKPR
jgi:3-dehydroquinate dehydratase-2